MDIYKDLYQQLIIDHNQHPQNFRILVQKLEKKDDQEDCLN